MEKVKKFQVTLDFKVAVYTELLELIGKQMVCGLKRDIWKKNVAFF